MEASGTHVIDVSHGKRPPIISNAITVIGCRAQLLLTGEATISADCCSSITYVSPVTSQQRSARCDSADCEALVFNVHGSDICS